MKNDIYRREDVEQYNHKLEPIRASAIILIIKLIAMLFLFELLYSSAFYLLNLQFDLPYDFHHHISLAFLGICFIKVLIQVFLTVFIVLSWANNEYYIEGNHLIKRSGIVNIEEESYDLSTLRAIVVNQSWLGRIFHYGDLTLKTSASGGYQVIVTMVGITNPQKREQMIKKYL